MSDGEREGHRRWGLGLAQASLALVACAAVMGWAGSFVGLHDFGLQTMHGYSDFTAWFVPATFDGAAFGTTLVTYRASINGRGAVRARILMWTFTAVSAWINWVHQPVGKAQFVAAGLPIAAVAVFDVVMLEMRGDFEARHGRRAFRLRPGLLLLRWLVDRRGTAEAFRTQIQSISVAALAGLGSDLAEESRSARQSAATAPVTTPPLTTQQATTAVDTAPPEPVPVPHRPPAPRPAPRRVSDETQIIDNALVNADAINNHVVNGQINGRGNGAVRASVKGPVKDTAKPTTKGSARDTAKTSAKRKASPKAKRPVRRSARDAAEVREAVRGEVRAALIAGRELPTNRQLADRYDRAAGWVGSQVKAVRDELARESALQSALESAPTLVSVPGPR
ncbi:MAG TPA: DUF2637 domain-containing protein [Pseudonocardiaceae bacterium]